MRRSNPLDFPKRSSGDCENCHEEDAKGNFDGKKVCNYCAMELSEKAAPVVKLARRLLWTDNWRPKPLNADEDQTYGERFDDE